MRIISVTFETTAQSHKDGQFSVPQLACDALGLKSGDGIALFIETPLGVLPTVTQLKSGTEIYGKDIAEVVKAGSQIRVIASRTTAI